MTNPFEDPTGVFAMLVNHEGQYSLWPASLPVPQGWFVALEDAERETCLDFVTEHWADDALRRPVPTPEPVLPAAWALAERRAG